MKLPLALLLLLTPSLHAAQAGRLAWREEWPRFRTSEYVVTGLALAGAAANFYLVEPPKSSAWRGGILFDDKARSALRVRDPAASGRAASLSDMLSFPLIGYSMLDGPVTAAWSGKDKDTAMQLALINAESFAVSEFLSLSISNAIPRSRPEGATCDPRSKYDPHCVKSFWSGHSANVFTAASLVCTQHGALGLYDGWGDGVACGGALAAASTVGFLRIASNDHHASDVIVGAIVGISTGYLMPRLLHFRSAPSENRLGFLFPSVGPGGGQLTYVKSW